MSTPRQAYRTIAVAGLLCLSTTLATRSDAYFPTPKNGDLRPGSGDVVDFTGVPYATVVPRRVWGKEYSHDHDVDASASPVATPNQNVLWDGISGNSLVANGRNYSPHPYANPETEVDALANTRDALFYDLISGTASLAFSIDNELQGYDIANGWSPLTLPSSGPVTAFAGTLGGAGELTTSKPGTVAFSAWASQNDVDSRSGMPQDVDGLELWGSVPDVNAPHPGDADKYSLEYDFGSGWSLFNEDGSGYLPHSQVVAAVVTKLGVLPNPADVVGGFAGMLPEEFIDLDAAMSSDIQLNTKSFDACGLACDVPFVPDQNGDTVLDILNPGTPLPFFNDAVVFSIGQVALKNGGYYATGSELFVLQADGTVEFLDHGGMLWDSSLGESHLGITSDTIEIAAPDINAIEAYGDLEIIRATGPGDVNGDGAVNLVDLDTLGANFGIVGALGGGSIGDFDNDGDVDLLDLDILGANFGTVISTSVPEPAGMALASLVLVGLTSSATRVRRP